MGIFENKYRIVEDSYLGFEAQVKFWFFPVMWFQMFKNGPANTFSKIEDAEIFIRKGKFVKQVQP